MLPAMSTIIKVLIRVTFDFMANVVGYFSSPRRGLFLLPPIKDPILLKSATELSHDIKSAILTSEQVVHSFITRIQEVDPLVNAVVDNRFESALREARGVDDIVLRHLQSPSQETQDYLDRKPLLGVPFTGKDSIAAEGLVFAAGLVSRKGVKASEDSTVTRRLKEAGGICLALTNSPELLLSMSTSNELFGRTNNPYDLSRIPGGSTGGGAAVLSYAGSVIGNAADVAGSIRIPASFCGVYGHKPSPGIIDCRGHFPPIAKERKDWMVFGPLTRYYSDLTTMFQVMAGGKEELNKHIPDFEAKLTGVDFSQMTIYFMEESPDPIGSRVDPEVKNALRTAVTYFQDTYGTKVEEIKTLEGMERSFEIFAGNFPIEDHRVTLQMTDYKGHASILKEILLKCVWLSNHALPTIFASILESIFLYKDWHWTQSGRESAKILKQSLDKLLKDKNAVLFYPTFPEVACRHPCTIFKLPNISCYNFLFNILEVPVTSCPVGLSKETGMPIGIQVIAGKNQDYLSLSVAGQIDKKFGGWIPPCKVSLNGHERRKERENTSLRSRHSSISSNPI